MMVAEIWGEFSQRFPVLAPKIVMGLFVLSVFWLFGIVVDKIMSVVGRRAHLHKDIIVLLGRFGRITLILLGLVSALGTVGVNITALVAGLGLTGFALGFALKDALSNILAGVLVLVYRPFEYGDHISVAGFEGEVAKIDLRYTMLKGEKKEILIPNSSLFNNPVVIRRIGGHHGHD